MPSNRRFKATGLIVLLTFLIILYISNGAKDTYNSPFYTRTVEAIKLRQDTEARENVVAEEKSRLERVQRLQKEHDRAMAMATSTSPAAAGRETNVAYLQDPEDAPPVDGQTPLTAGEPADPVTGREPFVAGRRKGKDDRVVESRPALDDDDGVAKVGNVEPKASSVGPGHGAEPESEEDQQVKLELNNILKKGPIIIFSKSYCPFSKKAKHILLDLYAITPPPHVVELDQHPLGPGLQAALHASTGRRTVPNVLISGRSIGGGDDVERLHLDGALVDTVQAMGGRRIMAVTPRDDPAAAGAGAAGAAPLGKRSQLFRA